MVCKAVGFFGFWDTPNPSKSGPFTSGVLGLSRFFGGFAVFKKTVGVSTNQFHHLFKTTHPLFSRGTVGGQEGTIKGKG
ncbi:MAG: hypothetical protein CM15mV74_500 [uncultured marine virus]|nr:MAG: hypothetical protein CM15mV74_500 [uncultured marine virus]